MSGKLCNSPSVHNLVLIPTGTVGIIVMQTLRKIPGGQVPFPLAWTCCLVSALLWPFSSVFASSGALPFLCGNKKHFDKISDNKPSNMSALAGTEAGDVVNWVSLPSLGHVVPPSGHGACTVLAAAWGKDRSRRGGRGWAGILPNIWASKPIQIVFPSGRCLWYMWAASNSETVIAKSWLLILEGGGVKQPVAVWYSVPDLFETSINIQLTFEIPDSSREESNSDLVLQLP